MIAAIVLAAGLSRRMGRPKLLLEIDGKPLVRWAVEAAAPHVDEVVVVTPADADAIRAALTGRAVRFVVNPRPEDGQGTSIAAGARALTPGTRAALVVLGDQPRLAPRVIPMLLEALRRTDKPIVAPIYRGQQGNPVLFASSIFDELAQVTGDAGARSVVQRDPGRVEGVSFDLPMPDDVDTPEDYRRIRDGIDGRAGSVDAGAPLGSASPSPSRYPCAPEATEMLPAGVRPPYLDAYPRATQKVRLLFVGWNPPRPFGGFWSLRYGDDLRGNLHGILSGLDARISADETEGLFLAQFLNSGYYFVHTVKCWPCARFPGFGRNSDRKDRDAIGLPLVRACVLEHLTKELDELRPEWICALGELAYEGLRVLCPGLDERARPTDGRRFTAAELGTPWGVLYTCFPTPAAVRGRGKSARDVTREHLQRFFSLLDGQH